MKVLIADKFEKVGVDGLKELGCVVVSRPDVTAEQLSEAIRETDPNILIVRGKKVNAAALEAGTSLQLVIRAGAGVDTIDVASASRLGIFVANCPGKNSIAVAELVLGLLLACDRRIPDQVAELRQGKWNKAEYSKARGLYGRTLGIVGLGQIGREIARRAQAFGMKVVAWSRHLTVEDASHMGIEYAQTPIDVAHVRIQTVQASQEGDEVPNCVNRLAKSSATHVLSVRHRNRPGVLAHVFRVLAHGSINVEEVENIIYHGAQATCARIHLDGRPDEEALTRIKTGNDDIISVALSEIS